MGSFTTFIPYVLAAMAVVILVFLVVWVMPYLSKRYQRKMGALKREEILKEIKSRNRIKDGIKTYSLYGLIVVFFVLGLIITFIVVLEEGPIPTTLIQLSVLVLVMLVGIFGSWLIRLIHAMNTRKGVRHYIATSADGRQVAELDVLYEPNDLTEIGAQSKATRQAWLDQLSLQFCPYGNPNGEGREAFCQAHCGIHEDPELTPRELLEVFGQKDVEFDPTFTATLLSMVQNGNGHKAPQYCSFYDLYQELVHQDKWRLYESKVERFGPFDRAIYILGGTWNDCMLEQREQFSVRGVLLPWKFAVAGFHLIDINHTGQIHKGRPEKVFAPILWGTNTAIERKQLYQQVTPQELDNPTLDVMLRNRPFSEEERIFRYVDTVDEHNMSLMERLLNFVDLSMHTAVNLVRQLLAITKDRLPLSKNRWAIALAIVGCVAFLFVLWLFIFKRAPTGDELNNVTGEIF